MITEKSLSDIRIERAQLVRTPKISCGNKINLLELNEDFNRKVGYDYSVLTHTDWILGYKKHENSYTTFDAVDVMGADANNLDGVSLIVTDSLDRIVEFTDKDLKISFAYKNNGSAYVYFLT